MKILLVEDDPHLGESIAQSLRAAHFVIDWYDTIGMAQAAALGGDYRVAVLDLNLVDSAGVDSVRQLRAARRDLPIIVVSARDEIDERIRALDAGADDFLVKPFDISELLARIRVVIRRESGAGHSQIKIGGLEIDLASCTVHMHGREVALRRREYQVLFALATRAGRIVSRQQLENALIDLDSERDSNYVEVFIHRLRRTLGEDVIQTVRGLGYIIRNDEPGT